MRTSVLVPIAALGLGLGASCSDDPGLPIGGGSPAPGDAAEFGVSGLLYNNNLVMYDRAQADVDGDAPLVLYPQIYHMRIGAEDYPVHGTFPTDRLVSGGPGVDGIPALTAPPLLEAGQAFYLDDGDLVMGVEMNGEARAYPHRILWWHELVNDVVGGVPITASFCPLTGTGLLFETDAIRDHLLHRPAMETTWGVWKQLHPGTRVLSDNTGFHGSYRRYPYGDYRSEDSPPLFSMDRPLDTRFPTKHPTLGLVVGETMMAYPRSRLDPDRPAHDRIEDRAIVVFFHPESGALVPYSRTVAGRDLTFDRGPDEAGLPTFEDRETGTRWDLAGRAIAGPLDGSRLEPLPATTAFWFAWAGFWPETRVHGD